MPVKSCQCPERREPITSRRWEICSKPGDGTTVVRCKACGAIWTTRAKFADALPYDIGPVTLPKDAFQHTRCDVALVGISALLWGYKDASKANPALERLWQNTWQAVEACRPFLRKRGYSRGAERDMAARRAIIDRYLNNITDAQLGWAEMFLGADTYLCGTIAICPKYTSGPEWQTLRTLMDTWSEVWLAASPDAGRAALEEVRK